MKLTELIDYSIALSAVPAQSAGFSVPLLLVDAPEVPIDKRYRTVTRSTYATTLTTTTTAEGFVKLGTQPKLLKPLSRPRLSTHSRSCWRYAAQAVAEKPRCY